MKNAPVLATLVIVVGDARYVRTIPAPTNVDGGFDIDGVDVEGRVRSAMRQFYKRGLVEGNWKREGFMSSIPGDAIDRIEAYAGELDTSVMEALEAYNDASDADIQDA